MFMLGQIPPQHDGTTIVYSIAAEDMAGNISATPFRAISVGLLRKHSLSLLAPRDLKEGENAWNSTLIWGDVGRSLTTGTGEDHFYFQGHPGRYAVWMLTQTRERGIHVVATHTDFETGTRTLIDALIPGGSADGWYKLGTVRVAADDTGGEDITVTPMGATGYCAYGEIIFTQDTQFTPPLQNSTLEWFNGVFVTGVSDWQTVSGVLTLQILPSGNLDRIAANARQTRYAGANPDLDDHPLTQNRDGSWRLDTRGFGAGDYAITVKGMKNFSADGVTSSVALVTTVINIRIQ
jgi:hypothetical protein